MKKLHLLKTVFLLCALVVGSKAWATDQTYSLTPNQASTGSSAASYITTLTEFSYNGMSWKMNQWNPNTRQIKVNQSNATDEFRFYNCLAFLGRIKQVVIKFQSLTVSDASRLMFRGGTSEVTETTGGTAGTWNGTTKTLTWTPSNSDNFTYFAFYQNGKAASSTNYLASSDAIVVTYESSAAIEYCALPTFSPDAGTTYFSSQAVTISCTTPGSTIYYTDDGSIPTTGSTQYTGAINLTTTKTIKAIAAKDGIGNSNTASATYTVVGKKTITQVRAQGTGAVLTQGIVTSVNGKTAYIQDEDAAIAVYNSAANLTVAAGDEIEVSGTLGTYQGLLQIQTPTINTVSTGNTVTPVVKTIKQINDDKAGSNALQGMLVQIEDAKVTAKTGTTTTDATIQQEESSVQYSVVAKGIAQATEYAVNDLLTLVGNIGSSSNTVAQIVNPTNVVVTPNVSPVINASNVTIAFDATSGEIAYTIDNPTSASLTAVKTTGDWISNVAVDGEHSKVTFTATVNTGAQRTGTITLSYTGADDKVVTITQKKNGIATLPFAWAGGTSSELLAEYGVEGNSLGDYAAGNAPYRVQFNANGDYIQIRTDGQPGVVNFGIKLIGGAIAENAGTKITIKSSANKDFDDGKTDKVFDISGSQNNTLAFATTTAFDSDVRYIRILFTKASGANIGVGPINISLPGEPSIPVVSGTTVTLTTSANMAGWRTYNNNTANKYTVDGTTKVYYASATGENKVTLEEIAGGVPANTVVILHQTSGTEIVLTKDDDATCVAPGSNELQVSSAGDNLGTVYRLGYKSGASKGVGFYQYTSTNAPAGVIYVSSVSTAREFLGFDFGDDTTGVNEVKSQKVDAVGEYFNLAGQRVAQPTKGLYIVNGKKVVIK